MSCTYTAIFWNKKKIIIKLAWKSKETCKIVDWIEAFLVDFYKHNIIFNNLKLDIQTLHPIIIGIALCSIKNYKNEKWQNISTGGH